MISTSRPCAAEQLGGHGIASRVVVAGDQDQVVPRAATARANAAPMPEVPPVMRAIAMRLTIRCKGAPFPRTGRPDQEGPSPHDRVRDDDGIREQRDADFDVREFARTAHGSHRCRARSRDARSDSAPAPMSLRLVRVLRDLERTTMQRMRNLLVTATHKDARVTAFLTTWAFEKFWIADALDADPRGHQGERPALRIPPAAVRALVPSAPSAAARCAARSRRNFAGPQIVAAHVTVGLIDEWITQIAYRRLGEAATALGSIVDLDPRAEGPPHPLPRRGDHASPGRIDQGPASSPARRSRRRSGRSARSSCPHDDRDFFDRLSSSATARGPGRGRARSSSSSRPLPGLGARRASTVSARLVP